MNGGGEAAAGFGPLLLLLHRQKVGNLLGQFFLPGPGSFKRMAKIVLTETG